MRCDNIAHRTALSPLATAIWLTRVKGRVIQGFSPVILRDSNVGRGRRGRGTVCSIQLAGFLLYAACFPPEKRRKIEGREREKIGTPEGQRHRAHQHCVHAYPAISRRPVVSSHRRHRPSPFNPAGTSRALSPRRSVDRMNRAVRAHCERRPRYSSAAHRRSVCSPPSHSLSFSLSLSSGWLLPCSSERRHLPPFLADSSSRSIRLRFPKSPIGTSVLLALGEFTRPA